MIQKAGINPDRHPGMFLILPEFFPVSWCKDNTVFVCLAVDAEFFCLLENIFDIGKGNRSFIQNLFSGTVVDQTAVVSNSITGILNLF